MMNLMNVGEESTLGVTFLPLKMGRYLVETFPHRYCWAERASMACTDKILLHWSVFSGETCFARKEDAGQAFIDHRRNRDD